MSSAVMTGAEGAGERWSVGGRTVSQSLLGAIALVLGIVGLAVATSKGLVPMYLAAIAEIALGLSLIGAGVALSGSYARLLAREEDASSGSLAGTTVDMFLGGAVVILAVLAILHVASEVLIPVAIIVVGVGLVLNSAESIRLANLESASLAQHSVARRIADEMTFATSSVRAVAGVAVLVLGILGIMAAVVSFGQTLVASEATIGFTNAMDLALVAMVIAGAALLLNGSTLSSRVVNALTH